MLKRLSPLALAFLFACSSSELEVPVDPGADADGHTAPSRFTIEQQRRVTKELSLDDQAEFEQARRGLIAQEERVHFLRPNGLPLWDSDDYSFLDTPAPASVNPSLWRRAQLNAIHGLFEVTDGIYQVRGYDLANVTLIRGNTGWIIVDPLTSRESATAALTFAAQYLGPLNIVAVIFTHSHVDHFGGIDAILDSHPNVRIVAPKRFLLEATSENVLAGGAMRRRATYMFGSQLARSERGYVDSGLGKDVADGSISISPSTQVIDHSGQELDIDGLHFVFQYAPDSEAPAELTFYLPNLKAFCGAELVSQTLHNLYTPRGAKVRDALKWSGYLDEAIQLFPDAEVCFNSHHWPVWGNTAIIDYLKEHRDTYRYIHDQTLRLANRGQTPIEIAEELVLPPSLRDSFANRGYYGTVNHNSKAVYQHYFGWFDGNPAHLNPHTPTAEAKRYVAAIGGVDKVLELGQKAYDEGDYRWAATLINHLVFAAPENVKARALLAASYDQLGYQAESGPWRNIYLSGAKELRHGVESQSLDPSGAVGFLKHMPIHMFFDVMMVTINGPDAQDTELTLNFIFTDIDESHVLTLENGVLHHRQAAPVEDANVTVKITKNLLLRMITRQAGLREIIFSGELDIDGSHLDLLSFFLLLGPVNDDFAIVSPD